MATPCVRGPPSCAPHRRRSSSSCGAAQRLTASLAWVPANASQRTIDIGLRYLGLPLASPPRSTRISLYCPLCGACRSSSAADLLRARCSRCALVPGPPGARPWFCCGGCSVVPGLACACRVCHWCRQSAREKSRAGSAGAAALDASPGPLAGHLKWTLLRRGGGRTCPRPP